MRRPGQLLLVLAFLIGFPAAALADADGDGHEPITTPGGDDCDDADPNRFPGNPEVCSPPETHDEDCDPATFGPADSDDDGYIDSNCCNGTNCGDDCDDGESTVHPTENEVCNFVDDDCNGEIDEGVTVDLFLDGDGDGYGTGTAAEGCWRGFGRAAVGGDCNDSSKLVIPGSMVCTSETQMSVCSTDGVPASVACPLGSVCHQQPNGRGICDLVGEGTAAALSIPAISPHGLGLLALGVASGALWALRRRFGRD